MHSKQTLVRVIKVREGIAVQRETRQESRAVAGNPRDAAVIFDP